LATNGSEKCATSTMRHFLEATGVLSAYCGQPMYSRTSQGPKPSPLPLRGYEKRFIPYSGLRFCFQLQFSKGCLRKQSLKMCLQSLVLHRGYIICDVSESNLISAVSPGRNTVVTIPSPTGCLCPGPSPPPSASPTPSPGVRLSSPVLPNKL